MTTMLESLIRYDRPRRWEILIERLREAREAGDGVFIAATLREWWSDGEFLAGEEWQEEVLDWFEHAGFVTDTSECSLTGTLTLYRGGEHLGISWTLDRGVAERFANRNFLFGNTKKVVRTAKYPAAWVFGYFTGRGEDEVIIDPDFATDIVEEELA
jgi:hypothetical protein